MKKNIIFSFLAVAGISASLLYSCGKENADNSEFLLNPPRYNVPGGQKMHYQGDCPVYNSDGSDYIYINGKKYYITYESGKGWVAKNGDGAVVSKELIGDVEGWSLCSAGEGAEYVGNGVYKNVYPDNENPPMSVVTTSNKVTMNPGGCIFRITSEVSFTMDIEMCDNDGNFFVSGGTLDSKTGLFTADSEEIGEYSFEGSPQGDGTEILPVTISLPMMSESVHVCSITITTGEGTATTTIENGLDLKRGSIYLMDLSAIPFE